MMETIQLFICSFLLLFHSSDAANRTELNCPEEFPCGNLGPTRFPLTESTRPDCGLLTINCSSIPNPKLKFGSKTFDVVFMDPPFLKLSDTKLSVSLQSRNCNTFSRNFSAPNTPSVITYRINPVMALYKCNNKTSKSNRNITDHRFRGYDRYDGCDGYRVYYSNPFVNRSREQDAEDIPRNCEVLQLPRQDVEPNVSGGGDLLLFPMLSSEFFISWVLSENCSQCHYKFRGQCVSQGRSGEFKCLHSVSSSSSYWKRILAAVLAGFGLLIGISLMIWFLKKRTNCLSHRISRETSSFDDNLDRDNEAQSNYFGAPMFCYYELQEATNNFDVSRELGDGAFGTVYHGKLKDGREVAVKRLYEFNRKRAELFINEVKILSNLRHPNLVTLYGCTSRHSHGLLVYEYVSNGTVADHLHGHRAKEGLLMWQTRMSIAVETAGALAYLHASDVIHRDVKTSNILLDDNFRVKVADFGLSRLFPDNVTHVSTTPQGTPGYVDPEYHKFYQLTDKSDVYSFGVVLVELISSMPAVDVSRRRDEINLAEFAMNKILKREFLELVDPSIWVERDKRIMQMVTLVAELAFQCLQPEKDMRPAMDVVLETLVEIQNGEFEDWKLNGDDDITLLSNTKSLISPADSLTTDHWIHSSSTSSTS